MQNRGATFVRSAIATVVVHALVSLVHGAAHQALGVTLTSAQLAFVVTVITVAPIVAVVLLWKRSAIGAVLLASSMGASLLFGVYYHFVEVSPDHVSHLPAGPHAWVVAFQFSAVLLMIVQGIGAALGVAVAVVNANRSKS
jgi:hypothetical protein